MSETRPVSELTKDISRRYATASQLRPADEATPPRSVKGGIIMYR